MRATSTWMRPPLAPWLSPCRQPNTQLTPRKQSATDHRDRYAMAPSSASRASRGVTSTMTSGGPSAYVLSVATNPTRHGGGSHGGGGAQPTQQASAAHPCGLGDRGHGALFVDLIGGMLLHPANATPREGRQGLQQGIGGLAPLKDVAPPRGIGMKLSIDNHRSRS
jgi:hypothetical protein